MPLKKARSWLVATKPVHPDDFAAAMAALETPEKRIPKSKPLAVAVSGGADSVALVFLLHRWGAKDMHILTVDHGLRPEAKNEVALVARYAESIGAKCKKFKWLDEKPEKSIQEEARRARYEMMADYCRKQKIAHLFLAHHADDQMETFLFRLAKGSGPQGLVCMKSLQKYDDDLTLARPLLSFTHDELIETCKKAKIEWVEDPSNLSDKYMRGRMRGAKEILEREGLTAKRIEMLIGRLERSQSFIDQQIEKESENIIIKVETERIEFRLSTLRDAHMELLIRLIQNAIAALRPDKDYPARLEDIERLAARIHQNPDFCGATLGGVKLAVSRKKDLLTCSLESNLT